MQGDKLFVVAADSAGGDQSPRRVDVADGGAEGWVVPDAAQVTDGFVGHLSGGVAGLFGQFAQSGGAQILVGVGQPAGDLPDHLAHAVPVFALEQDLPVLVKADDAHAGRTRHETGVLVLVAVRQHHVVDLHRQPPIPERRVGGAGGPRDGV